MLLHRFPITVVPDMPSNLLDGPQSITMTVSFYRRTVDPIYQTMIARQVIEGQWDAYVQMLLRMVLQSRKW